MTHAFLLAGPVEAPLDQSLRTDYTLVSSQLVMMACFKDMSMNCLWCHDLPLIEEPLILTTYSS